MTARQAYYGKYRGKIENNVDPLQQGRVQISCPAVLGDGQLSWAMPSAPYAGNGVGFFMVPPLGANVWVEFEGGDPDYPICGGCFWASGEAPAAPAVAEMKVIKTDGATITLNDLPGAGGITIETTQGLKITMNAGGIEITTGQGASVKLSGPQISLNNGAMEVT
jgi:uncharacterized protein involved in type VI secretion and phage assembly